MDSRELTCIGCPIGCSLTAKSSKNNIQIYGNACKIGVEYGINECKNPRRAITTSIKIKSDQGTKMISLKTSKDIPKNRIFDCLSEIKKLDTTNLTDIKLGDVVIKNILDLGVDIVSTR